MWRRIETEGREWEVRSVAGAADAASEGPAEILEFRAIEGNIPPRRVSIDDTVSLEKMDDAALLAAFRQALPIGGDHYGRPGKHMPDVAR